MPVVTFFCLDPHKASPLQIRVPVLTFFFISTEWEILLKNLGGITFVLAGSEHPFGNCGFHYRRMFSLELSNLYVELPSAL